MQQYINIIEEAIKLIGIDPATCRGEKPTQWNLTKGSASVWLDLWHIEKEARAYFQAISPVLSLDTVSNVAALTKELLELNHQLYGTAFTIYNNTVFVKVIREADGMDATEANAMILRVGSYADQYDDYLKNKYCVPPPPPNPPAGGQVPAAPPNL